MASSGSGAAPSGCPRPARPRATPLLYFRPHDVELVEGARLLAGVVAAIRRVGGTRRVELEIGGGRQTRRDRSALRSPAGEKTRIAFRPKRWRLFPAA